MNVDTAFTVLHFVGFCHHGLHSGSLAKVLIPHSKELFFFHTILPGCIVLAATKGLLTASNTASVDTFASGSEVNSINYLIKFLWFGVSGW